MGKCWPPEPSSIRIGIPYIYLELDWKVIYERRSMRILISRKEYCAEYKYEVPEKYSPVMEIDMVEENVGIIRKLRGIPP